MTTSHSNVAMTVNRDIYIEYEINDIYDPMVSQLSHPEKLEPEDFPVTTYFKLSQFAVLPRETYSLIQKLAKKHAKYSFSSLSPLRINLKQLRFRYGIEIEKDTNFNERVKIILEYLLNIIKREKI